MNAFVAIDPGASGGVAVKIGETTNAFNMPTMQELSAHLHQLQMNYENVYCGIEYLQMFKSDNDEPGMRFGIEKMLANYNQLIGVLKSNRVVYRNISPQSWQSYLKLRGKKDESKTARKGRYKDFAQSEYPNIKVTLKTSDALCLMSYMTRKLTLEPDWMSPSKIFNR